MGERSGLPAKSCPDARREFVHARSRMLPHVLQHVDQIIVGIDVVQPLSPVQ
jgi:hypothetical protein